MDETPFDDRIELCSRCRQHVVYRLAGKPYCYHCGSDRPGRYYFIGEIVNDG